jgi:hypothetical protein
MFGDGMAGEASLRRVGACQVKVWGNAAQARSGQAKGEARSASTPFSRHPRCGGRNPTRIAFYFCSIGKGWIIRLKELAQPCLSLGVRRTDWSDPIVFARVDDASRSALAWVAFAGGSRRRLANNL